MSLCKWIPILVALATLVAASEGFSNQTFQVSNNSLTSYRIDGATNPTLNLVRGETYTFIINASGHPFWIKTVNSVGTANAFNNGVTNNGDDVGTITFVVPGNAPASLHYNCEFHASMNGAINVSDPVPVEPVTWGKLKHQYRP